MILFQSYDFIIFLTLRLRCISFPPIYYVHNIIALLYFILFYYLLWPYTILLQINLSDFRFPSSCWNRQQQAIFGSQKAIPQKLPLRFELNLEMLYSFEHLISLIAIAKITSVIVCVIQGYF